MKNLKRFYLVITALIAWGALVLQLHVAMTQGALNGQPDSEVLFNYFSYFTVLTNILCALALTLSLLGLSPHNDVMGAIATYITVVGVTYFTLLRELWSPVGLHFIADAALHYVMPACSFSIG